VFWHSWHNLYRESPELMLRTSLDTWRATLFVSLGLVTSGCGGDAASAEGALEPGEDPSAEDAIELPEHLRCEGETATAEWPGDAQCSNGIVHRVQSPEQPECAECPVRGPTLPASGPAICADDSDCPTGTLCIASVRQNHPTPDCSNAGVLYERHFACQTAADVCGADSQCPELHQCIIVGPARQCTPSLFCPVPGRPFSVGAEARVAGIRHTRDWCGPALAEPDTLDARSRELTAQHWQAAALMEHASIAAFARFTLQLLQLGAPLSLTLESQAAMLDETDHARRCFALATRYGGNAVGPGELDMDGAFAAESLSAIVEQTFDEGCLGETCAALQAAEALATAGDEVVRATLEVIARDEQRHAELAWRFIAWALEREPTGGVREVLETRLRALRSEAVSSPSQACRSLTPSALAASQHGVLSADRCREIHSAVIREIVLPCAERLLAPASTARRPSTMTRAPESASFSLA
jgi:hypothetical protein